MVLLPSTAQTQNILLEDTLAAKNRIILRNQRSFGVLMHSGGFGLQYRRFHQKTYYKRRGWEIQLVEMKTDKQIRMVNPYFDNSRSFVYGKLNSIFIGRLGFGQQRIISREPYFGGVEISMFFMAGASVSFAKPIYLYIVNYTNDSYDYYLSTERYDPEKHFLDNIYGRAPFTEGIGETKLYPGAYLHFGVNFEFGDLDKKPKSLEVGAILDLYPSPVPIMAYQDKHHYFLSIYLSFNFGKRFD